MGVRIRLRMGLFVVVLLSLLVAVPTTDAAKNPCDNCGNSCWMEYKTGWSDCSGSPAGCLRTVVC